jgi:transcription termination factor Rho
MTKAELESKHLSELHSIAAEAGVPKYRMLSRGELVAKLSDGDSGQGSGGSARPQGSSEPRGGSERERPPRRRRRSGSGSGSGSESGGRSGGRDSGGRESSGRESGGREAGDREPRRQPRSPKAPAAEQAPAAPEPAAAAPQGESSARPKRRRRRRFGRRKEGVTIQDLLLPPAAGRQAILCAESRQACTALLRGVAGDIAADSKGPDPVILLIDPSPEELADWKREAPQAEIVAAGQARHASDALAQAAARAGSGDDVMLLVDSLTRLAEAYGDADSAKEFFDAGRVQGSSGGGSLTVVAALERPAQG